MARQPRETPAGYAYHVYNRAAARLELFADKEDYRGFLNCIELAKKHYHIELFGICIMPNHWHLALFPHEDGVISSFMHRVTSAHVRNWQKRWDCVGSGPIYQGRYRLKPVKNPTYYLNLLRYIERNPVRANLANSAEEWIWSSASMRMHSEHPFHSLIDEGPIVLPDNWLKLLRIEANADDEASIKIEISGKQ